MRLGTLIRPDLVARAIEFFFQRFNQPVTFDFERRCSPPCTFHEGYYPKRGETCRRGAQYRVALPQPERAYLGAHRPECRASDLGLKLSSKPRGAKSAATEDAFHRFGDSEYLDTVFGELAAVIENALWDRDYQTLLCISQRDVEREVLQLANLVSRQVDGILLAYTSEQSKAIEFSKEISIPFVFIDRRIPDEYSVATDNYLGGQLAARHLTELGHRCIGMLCGEAEIEMSRNR